MLGEFCRVTWRKTPGGQFLEPVISNPHAIRHYGKVESLPAYHAKLMAIGCVPTGTDEKTGATVYRTPEGTTLAVRSLGPGRTLSETCGGDFVAQVVRFLSELQNLVATEEA